MTRHVCPTVLSVQFGGSTGTAKNTLDAGTANQGATVGLVNTDERSKGLLCGVPGGQSVNGHRSRPAGQERHALGTRLPDAFLAWKEEGVFPKPLVVSSPLWLACLCECFLVCFRSVSVSWVPCGLVRSLGSFVLSNCFGKDLLPPFRIFEAA